MFNRFTFEVSTFHVLTLLQRFDAFPAPPSSRLRLRTPVVFV